MQPLYNRDGRAIVYIADNGVSIYFYDGEPAGWVFQESLVFAYSGKFLGWLMYGWLCDPAGNPAFFTDRSSGGPKRPPRLARPMRAPRGSRPPRRRRQQRPTRPGMTSTWSAISDESFFAAPPAEDGAPLEDEGSAPQQDSGDVTEPAPTDSTTPDPPDTLDQERGPDRMTQFQTLRIETEGELGFLTLDRPDRLNAMNTTMLDELADAARWFDQHLDVRVVIVRGAGRAFCAGADLKGASASGSPSAPPEGAAPGGMASWQARREASQRGLRMANAIEQMRAVTIAQLHGYAVGGGFLLAVSCDLRVAADDVVFFIPEVELGIPLTWGGVPRLVRELGPALTKELVMTCRRFGAQEAKEARFLNRVVPADRLDAEARALAAAVLAMPAVPVVITKDQVNAAAEAMVPARSAYLEGDALNGVSADEASQETRRRYAERAFKKSV